MFEVKVDCGGNIQRDTVNYFISTSTIRTAKTTAADTCTSSTAGRNQYNDSGI